jgi:hypothetical protein
VAGVTAHIGPAHTQRVNLVEEQHAGRVAAGHLEDIVHGLLAANQPPLEHIGDAYR